MLNAEMQKIQRQGAKAQGRKDARAQTVGELFFCNSLRVRKSITSRFFALSPRPRGRQCGKLFFYRPLQSPGSDDLLSGLVSLIVTVEDTGNLALDSNLHIRKR